MPAVSENQAPVIPGYPQPDFDASLQGCSLTLSWKGGDPDEHDSVFYEVYLGTQNPPAGKVVSRSPRTSLQVSGLTAGMVYYWKVVASDGMDATAGPVWNFSTAPETN